MAESPEHEFLKNQANLVLSEFSSLKLYGFTETNRKTFDFSCLLERDWSRPLVGQVLWKHIKGLEKDIRTLLADTESEVRVYIASDTIKHRTMFEEVVSDYRRTGRFNDLFRLKLIWVPSDFDADKEERELVGEIVKSQIIEDILFNIVFGHINAENLELFLNVSGIFGLNLAILYDIATQGFLNISTLQKRLGVSPGPIREKLSLMAGVGFIESPPGVLLYNETPKGRVFLDIASRVVQEYPILSSEMSYILNKLNCIPVSEELVISNSEVIPKQNFITLMRTINYASKYWGIDFSKIDYSRKIILSIPEGCRKAT